MSTAKVETSYADGSANTVRPLSVTYPNGRAVTFDYGPSGGMNDRCSRVAALVDDDDTPLVEYAYLGLGAVVQQDSPEPDLRLTLVSLDGSNDPDTGDIYAGLDRFGRVKDVRWRNVSGNSDLSRVQYGYDRASNRVWRQNPTDTADHHDWQYAYDGLHRLEDAVRGTLTSSSGSGLSTLDSPLFAQCWTLDPTGNWRAFRQADAGGGNPWDLVQQRLGSPVNEILGIANTVGSPWAQPAYDAAGNMTTIPQPNDPAESYTATYDGWNRLVKLVDPATDETVQENQYDARTFRTVTKRYTGGTLAETRHAYYTDGWRCVEERLGTSPDAASANRQFVWGRRYIDDLVLRDRTTTGPLDERLYALQDGNWNVTAVVDGGGDVQERYEYDPYGTLRVLDDAFDPRAASSFDWETTYCGYRFDALTGLYPVRFRVLIPMLGWGQRDPIGYANTTNLYAYLELSPASGTDPAGLQQQIGRPDDKPIVDLTGATIGRLRPGWTNCLGYATGSTGAVLPAYSAGSLSDILSTMGYSCTEGVAATDCQQHCQNNTCSDDVEFIEVYLYVILSGVPMAQQPDRIRACQSLHQRLQDNDRTLFGTPFGRQNPWPFIDYHALRGEPDGTFTYQPNLCTVGHGDDVSRCFPDLDPNPNYTLPGPDYFNSQQRLERWCCCR